MKPGSQIGPYHFTASIGAGGMGEVFRARDIRLNRDVAIKVLPKDFAADADRLRRFEQEAKTLAALNHPNVLTIHDAGVHEGAPYLVSELLEGRTLREEMNCSGAVSAPGSAVTDRRYNPLPHRKATDYALQIAQGLAAAHDKGIIHRDLKPENIFVTKDVRVKILDFGLAKLRQREGEAPAEPKPSGAARSQGSAGASPSQPVDVNAPTQVQVAAPNESTEPGMVLGTPAYMAPEQVRGEPADHRADIFAFGCVLYEMLSGARAFRRDTPAESMHAVLNEEPPELTASQSTVSPALERIMRRCLEKMPQRRFQTADDLAFALENISTSSFTASAGRIETRRGVSWQAALPWAVAALCLIIALGAILYPRRPASNSIVGNGSDSRAAPAPLRKLEIRLPLPGRKGTSDLLPGLAISPDGRKLAYANADGLWLRSLERLDPPTLLSSAEKVSSPFWSPQSTDVAWFEGTSLKRAPATGGRAMTICRTPTENRVNRGEGGAWLQTDEILFTTGFTGLYRVPSQGGNAELVLPPGEGEADFHDVSALPDGRGVVFIIHRQEGVDTIGVWNPKDGKDGRKILFQRPGSHLSNPVMTSAGHMVFQDRNLDARENLWAVPISRSALELAGEPVRLTDGGFLPSASSDGTLALSLHDWSYLRFAPRRLVWVDRSGRIGVSLGNVHKGMSYPQLSHDERFVAFEAGESFEAMQIWILDGTTFSVVPLRSEGGAERSPFWLPGGRGIVVTTLKTNQPTAVIRAIEGSRPSEAFGRGSVAHVSRSGHYAFLFQPGATPTNFYVRLTGDRTQPILLPSGSPSLVDHRRLRPNLSPDDATLAFQSDGSDQPEIWAVAFPGFTNRVLVSRGGGSNPRWSRDGTELFYLSGDGRAMMAAPVAKQSGRQFAEPVKLFDLPESILAGTEAGIAVLFDVSADGQRFLMMQNVPDPNAPSPEPKVLLIQNWFEEYRAKK